MNEQMLHVLNIILQSQWKNAKEIQASQWLQMQKILNHVMQTVPFYQSHFANHFHSIKSPNDVEHLPILTRQLMKSVGDEIKSLNIPEAHGELYPLETSGSTGKSVQVLATDFTRLFFDAMMLREHEWHQRDFQQKSMGILWAKREVGPAPEGIFIPDWGAPINQYKSTGNGIFINIASPTHQQIEALLFYQPGYLVTYPSQMAALAEYVYDHHIKMDFLKCIRLTGETLTDDYKQMASLAWPHVILTDIYSGAEVGHIAQQCREYYNYHVNSENVYLEIVDEHNNRCEVGQTGRVLITSLMNYATPLIRYEIGDYAERGEPCKCGRGLPVIQKILGRKRNRLTLPSGETRFPYLADRDEVKKILKIPIRQFQFVQNNYYEIEVKFVSEEILSKEEEIQLTKLYQKSFGYPFNFIFNTVPEIPLSPTGKFEEFVSMV
jgi:phenylacetate-CoA ligase